MTIPAPAATMQWASAVSRRLDFEPAVAEVCEALTRALGPAPPDLALAFLSAHHVPDAARLQLALKERLRPACLAGASTHGVISSEHELEGEPALVVTAARLPGVTLDPFVVLGEGWEEAVPDAAVFERLAPGVAGAEVVVLLGDPFSLGLEHLLAAFNRHAPGVRLAGGLASAAPRPGSNALFLNDWFATEGGFALAFSGALRADVVVSQGCRAVGPPLEVTRGEDNVVAELDGQPALERAEQVLRELAEDERERLGRGLYIGVPVRPGGTGRGDYLIRNLLGADRERGYLAMGERVTPGQRLRLHVRDAQTAREDLELLLSPQGLDTPARAALLFACNGRGVGLYGAADGDIGTLQAMLGGVPVAGMFCAGEVGPVGGRNFLHGHTASIVILRSR